MNDSEPWGFDPRTSFKISIVLGAIVSFALWYLYVRPVVPLYGKVRLPIVSLNGWFVMYVTVALLFVTWMKLCLQPAIPLNSQARLVFCGIQTRDVWGEMKYPFVPVPLLFEFAQPDSIMHFVLEVAARNRCASGEAMDLTLRVLCMPNNVYLTAKMSPESLRTQLGGIVQGYAQGVILRSGRTSLLGLSARTHGQMLSQQIKESDFYGVSIKVLSSAATEASAATQALYDLEAEMPLRESIHGRLKSRLRMSDAEIVAAVQARTGVTPTVTTHVIREGDASGRRGGRQRSNERHKVNLLIDNTGER